MIAAFFSDYSSFFPIISILLFVFVVLAMIFEFLDSVLVMATSIFFMIIVGMIHPNELFEMIDWKTILLIFGMMIVVEVTRTSNVLAFISLKIAQTTKGNPLFLLILFALTTLLLSTFLANATTMMVLVPITIALVKGMGLNPKPYLITEILFSDIGGALTLIGDPTNVMIGSANDFSFFDFLQHQIIPVFLVSLTVLGILIIKYWNIVKPIGTNLPKLFMNHLLMEKVKREFFATKLSQPFIIRIIFILIGTLLFFVFGFCNLSLPLIAFLAATSMLLINKKFISPSSVFKKIDWHLLFFFAGLFIHVAVIEKMGVLEPISMFIAHHSDSSLEFSLYILWGIGLLSAFIENIPLVAMMIPVIQGVLATGNITGNTEMIWYALSLGACFGGNGSLIGSSANMIVAKLAERDGVKISFFEYFKIGYPITIVTMVISSIFLFFIA